MDVRHTYGATACALFAAAGPWCETAKGAAVALLVGHYCPVGVSQSHFLIKQKTTSNAEKQKDVRAIDGGGTWRLQNDDLFITNAREDVARHKVRETC